MGKYFMCNTPVANLERMMALPPNFAPRSSGNAILCRYSVQTAADCRACVKHRRQSHQGLTCLHLTKRLQAGMVTVAELAAETVRPWKHLGLKQRTMGIAGRAGGFHFADRLHIMRMLEMTRGEKESVSSRWLAAVYLLSASAPLWQRTLAAVTPGQIDFAGVRLGDASIQDYVLYRTAKGLSAGALGVTSEELADAELVSDDTLLLILCAALIARYGPEVMNIGRAGGQCGSAGRAEQFQREQGPQMGGNGMMVLYISKGENDSEVPIHFPAEPAEVRSAITALEHSSTASGPVEIRRVECPIEILEQDIKRAGLNSAEDIQKLNALTERIDAMSQQEKQLFTAVLSCECPSNLDEVLSFAGDLNRYELLNGVTTDWYLGKWAVENRKLETDVPEAIQPFLDYSAVGREYAASHHGEFCSLGYLKNREAAPVQGQAPYVIRLTLTSSGRQHDLSLPAAEEQLEQAKRALDVEDFSQAGITAVKFSSPHLAGLLPLDAAAVEDVNTFALCLREMEQEDGELRKFCAVLEAEQPETFTEALNIAMDRDDYEQIPEDMDEYGKQVLRRAGADDEIIDTIDGYMNFARLGEDSMEEDGVRRTEFGLVRRLSKPFPPQQEMGPQMM